jgi:uncharacterized protein YchJ
MRSRFTAYALGNKGEYLLATWFPATAKGLSADDLSLRRVNWQKLEVINKSQQADTGSVEFKAYFSPRYEDGENEVMHEISEFTRVKGRWYYVDDLRQHWTDYRPKFRAAGRYAQQRGWRFRLVTERHVRTPYLDNVKSLLLDSGVVALTMSYDPIFVIISSSKPLSFKDLKNDLGLSNNIEA